MKRTVLLFCALALAVTPAFALVKGFHSVSDVTAESPKHIVDCVNAMSDARVWSKYQHTRVEGMPSSLGARYKDATKDGEDFVIFLMDEIHEQGDDYRTAMLACYVKEDEPVSLGEIKNIF